MTRTNKLWLLLLTGLLVSSMREIRGSQGSSAQMLDSISGAWSDACPCSIPCPCWRTGRANVRHCLNVQVFQPTAPSSSNAKATFVAVGVSDGYWAPAQYTLYVDNSADALVVRKLSGFFQTYYRASPPDFRRSGMTVTMSGHSRHLEIPGTLDYRIESLTHATISENVRGYLYEWLMKPEQWKTRIVSYRSSSGEAAQYSGTNALVAQFRLTPADLQAGIGISGILAGPGCQNRFGTHPQRTMLLGGLPAAAE